MTGLYRSSVTSGASVCGMGNESIKEEAIAAEIEKGKRMAIRWESRGVNESITDWGFLLETR